MDPYLLTKIYDEDLNEITLAEALEDYEIYNYDECDLIDIDDHERYYLPRILSINIHQRPYVKLKNLFIKNPEHKIKNKNKKI